MMKQSFIYEKRDSVGDKQCAKSERNSVGSIGRNDLLDGVFKIMKHIVVKEERIQLLKQMLTTRSDFNPQTLFSYISRDERYIDKRHIVLLLEENTIPTSEDEIKLYFNSYGYKDRIDYGAFANLIFPVDVNLLKYISVTGIKKYANQSTLTQHVLCIFLLLVKEQIALLLEIDELKMAVLPKISRKQIKSLMRTIKKTGDCYSQMEIESQSLIKYEELKSLFKNLHTKHSKPTMTSARKNKKTNNNTSTETNKSEQTDIYSFLEKSSVCVFRKLSMGKSNFINLEDFEFWLKPWTKLRSLSINIDDGSTYLSNVFEISGINQVITHQSHVSINENVKVPLSHAY